MCSDVIAWGQSFVHRGGGGRGGEREMKSSPTDTSCHILLQKKNDTGNVHVHVLV